MKQNSLKCKEDGNKEEEERKSKMHWNAKKKEIDKAEY